MIVLSLTATMREKPLFTDENVMKPYIELVARETALSNNRQAVHLSRATSNVIPRIKRDRHPPRRATLVGHARQEVRFQHDR